jgi:hypothetical protein
MQLPTAKGVPALNAIAMVAAPLTMLASYIVAPSLPATAPHATLAEIRQYLTAFAAHRPAALTAVLLYGAAAALLIPAFAGLRTPRAKGGRLVSAGVPVAQAGLAAVIGIAALLALVPYALTASGTDPAVAAQILLKLNNSMNVLYAIGPLFPLGTLIVTIGLLRDPIVRWWAIPLGAGTIPTLIIFSGIPGIIAAVLMLAGFAGTGLLRKTPAGTAGREPHLIPAA